MSVSRVTDETNIRVTLNLEGGNQEVVTGLGFFDHMIKAFARHGGFGVDVYAKGDLEVDAHHTVEDVGIVLGQAFALALGDKAGIHRYGQAIIPMDEALVMAVVDISGRGQAYYDVPITVERVGEFDTQLVKEFFLAFAREAHITLHVRLLSGENAHHIIEAVFKACAHALKQAVNVDVKGGEVPSTKGVL